MELNLDLNGTQDVPSVTGEVSTPSMAEFKAEKVPTPVAPTPVSAPTSGPQVIGKIQSAMFGGFTKILSFLSQGTSSQDIIYIKEGKLNLVKNAGYIFCDLSIMFDNNNLELIDPNKSIKLLNLIKGGDEVVFVKDNENTRYLISSLVGDNPSTTISLPQPDQSNNNEVSAPNVGELIFRKEISIDVVDNIQSASKALECAYLKFDLIKDSLELTCISTSDDIFKQDFNTNQNTDTFKVFNPFPISKPDEFYLEIHKNGEDVWLKTISITGMVQIEYSEKIETEGEFDSFSL